MALDSTSNFAIGTLTAGIASGATSMVLGAGESARMPATPFNATIWNATDYSNASDAFYGSQAEIVRATARVGDTFTITRAQESTTAQNLNTAGKTYRVMSGLTASAMSQISDWMPDKAFIRGMKVIRSSTTFIQVTAGSFYLNSTSRVQTSAASIFFNVGALPPVANTQYQVYAYMVGSVVTIEVFAEDPPSFTYSGTARSRATGNLGRWLGSFMTENTGVVCPMVTNETGANAIIVAYAPAGTLPNRILSAGVQTVYTQILATPVCPRYASYEALAILSPTYVTGAGAQITMSISPDGIFTGEQFSGFCVTTNQYVNHTPWIPLNSLNGFYYRMAGLAPGVGAAGYVDITGVKYAR